MQVAVGKQAINKFRIHLEQGNRVIRTFVTKDISIAVEGNLDIHTRVADKKLAAGTEGIAVVAADRLHHRELGNLADSSRDWVAELRSSLQKDPNS